MKRKAEAFWTGTGKDGNGHLTTQSNVLNETQYSFSSRFENGMGTTPEELIAAARFNYISVSYNNEGLMPENEIRRILQRYGKYDLVTTEYKRFKADKTKNRNHKASETIEYLHILEKNKRNVYRKSK